MTAHFVLLVGLALFLGIHLMPVLQREKVSGWKTSLGEMTWKGIHSAVSLAGLVIIIWGFSLTRVDPVFVWTPPAFFRHLNMLLSLIAMILLVAAYVPRNHIKARMGHPMYLAIKVWALGHLLSNGRLGDIMLFAVFLAWAVTGFSLSRKHDRLTGRVYPAGTLAGTAVTLVAGLLLTAAFVFYLHYFLIGIPLR